MHAKKNRGTKLVVLLLAVVLMVGCTIGGTLAWLVAEKQTITNTFVAGEIGTLALNETATTTQTGGQNTYVIIPGAEIFKDPVVSYTPAEANDVGKVYIFVEVSGGSWSYNSETNKFTADGLSWTVAEGWTHLTGNVFYMEATAAVTSKAIIDGNKVAVASTIKKGEDMTTAVNAADGLTFTAYAIQAEGFTGDSAVNNAWTAVKANDAA